MYSLEREYLDLRARRVAIRSAIKNVRNTMMFGDYFDARNQLVGLEQTLRGTEKRWAELHALTGRKRSLPVSIALPRTAAKHRAPAPYLNRMITAR